MSVLLTAIALNSAWHTAGTQYLLTSRLDIEDDHEGN